MQKPLAFLLILMVSTLTAPARDESAETRFPSSALTAADSLFSARLYTQAFEHYAALHKAGYWSPAMLLKMAYIQEGLGHLGESLYYLNLYALSSNDPQAAMKMAELAEKNHLEGYQEDALDTVTAPLREYYLPIAGLLASLSLLIVALLVYRRKTPSFGLVLVLALLAAALYVHVQYSKTSAHAIVSRAHTYLMSAPSSGSSVVEILGEGHRLRVKGHTDAWLRVQWRDGEAYIRDFLVRKVEL